jgi:hypothetical protein
MDDQKKSEKENKIISFEDNKDITIFDDEDTKKKEEKKRKEIERRRQNESVLRNYKLGKYKNK